ncbi:hybrid sensor histidine kinase/response regulator [Roseateles sp.]|uniref:hybrid sensor histidine kinase/response regulator n=1 Tax=Roseateles sp. TaxID=1971397 RepID=UPI003BA7F6F1
MDCPNDPFEGQSDAEGLAAGAPRADFRPALEAALMLAEQRAERAERALQISEMRFHVMIEGLRKVAVQGYDRERRVVAWNSGSEALYGYSRAEALGQRLEDLIIPAPMREAVIAGVNSWLASGAVTMPAEELVLQGKDGRPVQVYSSHTMQINSHGEPELYCVDIDLSERAKLEAQLREAQKLESMGRLAGGIAHDFNNVLGGLLANLAIAREQLQPDHAAQPRLALIARGAHHARDLVQQILAFSRRQPRVLVSLDLRALIEDTLDLLLTAKPPSARLTWELPQQSVWVRADATQIKQVLINLCTNAFHALKGRPGRVQLTLSLASTEPAGDSRQALLQVQDDGCGMDAETRMHLFEPFFTTKQAGEGSGLGLAVVHGIVLAHHGHIEVESEAGQGACFKVYLPVLAQVPEPAQEQPALAQLEPARGRHVLYLDDDEVMRLAAEGLLQGLGYRVSLFQQGREALAAVAATPQAFDLVVTDFNMPDLSGLDLARQLQQIRPDLPVILSSGYMSDALQAQAQAAGIKALLRKEMSLEELGPMIAKLLA